MALAFLTNGGLVCVAVQRPISEFNAFRADLDGYFMSSLDAAAPDLAERARSGKREERFYGTADLPNFFRKPYGPGWALVGDAGYHKDPITARGISDAFRDAELLADAIDASLSGGIPMQEALADYEQTRNEAARPTYEEACQAAAFMPLPAQVLEVRARIRGNQALVDKYMGLGVSSVKWEEFAAAMEANG
jgi:2-polyprenyl-6-methoxyphenol hydroxylase-like FAD-dependent oxidoreductase